MKMAALPYSLVYGIDEKVSQFVASLIPHCAERGFGPCAAIGVADERNGLIGGFVFHDWSPEAGVIEMSIAATDQRWLTRPVLYGAFSYVFDDIRCQMVCNRTMASNATVIRITKAYGFKQVTIPRLFGRDMNGIVSTLTVEDWRANGFHKENAHGKKLAS